MDAFLRGVDGEVEQWYRESQAGKSRKMESGNGSAGVEELESQRRGEELLRRKEELVKAAVGTRVRTLREQLERRE